MKIELYHGTSAEAADLIMQHGFKDRVAAGRRNWDGHILSKAGFVYLTRAYPFFYAMNAAGESEIASVLKVTVDTDDLYPDEDILRFGGVKGTVANMRKYKHFADIALEKLGNVAIKPEDISHTIGRKDFKIAEMWQYSDPAMSPLNYQVLGGYYRKLTDTWWDGGDWRSVDQTAEIINQSIKK